MAELCVRRFDWRDDKCFVIRINGWEGILKEQELVDLMVMLDRAWWSRYDSNFEIASPNYLACREANEERRTPKVKIDLVQALGIRKAQPINRRF